VWIIRTGANSNIFLYCESLTGFYKTVNVRTYNVTLRRVRASIFAVEKQKVLHISWVSVCGVRYTARNAHAPYYPQSLRLYNIFPHFLPHGTIFGKKNSLNVKCEVLFSLQFLSETFCLIRRTERVMIKIVCRSSREVPLFLCEFNETWIFSTYFLEIIQYHISWKSFKWTDQFCHADRRTDMTKPIVALRNFCECVKQWSTPCFSRPTCWPATGPVSARPHLAHSDSNYAIPFFLLFGHLGSVLRLHFLRPRSAPANCFYDMISRRWRHAPCPHSSTA
jgi:hypothetical protein